MSRYRGPRLKKIRRLGALPGLTTKTPKSGSNHSIIWCTSLFALSLPNNIKPGPLLAKNFVRRCNLSRNRTFCACTCTRPHACTCTYREWACYLSSFIWAKLWSLWLCISPCRTVVGRILDCSLARSSSVYIVRRYMYDSGTAAAANTSYAKSRTPLVRAGPYGLDTTRRSLILFPRRNFIIISRTKDCFWPLKKRTLRFRKGWVA
jgi:hypothetical protein